MRLEPLDAPAHVKPHLAVDTERERFLHVRRQQAGITALITLASTTPILNFRPGEHPNVRTRFRNDQLRGFDGDRGAGGRIPLSLAARQATPGALKAWYAIPRVVHERRKAPLLVSVALAAILVWAANHWAFVLTHQVYLPLLPIWLVTFSLSAVPLFAAWADRPFTITGRQQRYMDTLHVTVAVPVYNEDPELLDRCIWSLVNSSRPPQCVHVVEDGKSGDYARLRSHWKGWHGRTLIRWERLPQNMGKKWAQSRVFASNPEADIFITVDSDTTLERNAISEGLKPFADPRIASVAGIEEIWNKHANWLTKICAARNTFSQLVSWSTQSVFGDVLINRGTFALYRAGIIREIVPAYVNETFLGHPVKLGDDSALTLFARAHGRTVQQVTAFCLPMYPETLSHHFRQWLRWARGGSVRNYWRIKYLPFSSWGWWWTALAFYYTVAALFVPVYYFAIWPKSEHLVKWTAASILAWSFSTSLHVLRVRREGESVWTRISSVLAYPAGLIWSSYFLRPIRFYGIFTCFRQGWVTRQAGIEIGADGHRPATPRIEESLSERSR
jgi:hyaluronan synthase